MSIKITFKMTGRRKIRLFSLVAVLACFSIQGISVVQAADEPDPEHPVQKQETAPVKLDGNVLFYVRGTSSYPPSQRAAAISDRIETIAAEGSIPADSVTIVPAEDRRKIYAGKEFIMNVFDIDAKGEKVSKEVLAEFIHQKIVLEIKAYRYARSTSVLVKKSLYALGATVLLTLLLIALFWLIRRINSALEKKIKSRFDKVEDKSFSLIRSKQLWSAFNIVFKSLKIIITILMIAAFLQYILGLFPWTNGIAAYTLKIILDPILTIGNGFLRFLPSLVFLIVIFFLTRYLLKLIKLLFTGIHQGAIVIKNFDAEWAMPTYRILRVGVVAFAVIVAYPYIPGSDSNAFKGVTVFLGVLFSLGSSSLIGNVIAGYSMTFRRAFRKGDLIEQNNQMGFVEEQKLLVTRLRTFKNEEIVIPNSLLLNSNIINFSKKAKEHGLILHTSVGIGYETPWRQVEAMLKEAAGRTEGLLKQPPPFVLQKALGDFAVNYELNVYCDNASAMLIQYTGLHQNILDVFNENNVQIMTPAYMGDPETPKVVPKDQWNTPLAEKR
ncbi:MAG: mechanosensitive ion channel family protein [Bacteroidetes bacterium]|nr:mechanosensitive ion channel family protein [Bacteroidota bacterium]